MSTQKNQNWAIDVCNVPSRGLTLIVGSQKMGVFLQSTEATPCGHLLK